MDFDSGLLAKYLIDTLSPDEMEKVTRWRDASTENENIFSELMGLRISKKYKEYNTSDRADQSLNALNARINKTSRFHLFRSIAKYAAVMLLLVSASYVGWNYFKPETYVTISVEDKGLEKQIVLADGTTVWLKAASSLKIPEGFSEEKRTVFLRGEAYFDVVKNRGIPFSVSTEYMNVKVLGTTFDVKVDTKTGNVETILVKGKVALLDKNWNRIMDMLPGEKVTYKSLENEYITENIDVNVKTAWRLGQLIFDNLTLREIAYKLSAQFDVDINIDSPKLAGRKFRCVINKNETLPDIFNLLKYMAPMDYKIEGRKVYLFEKQNRMPME